MVAKIQGYVRKAYVAAASAPRTRRLMNLYTAKEGTVASKALNKALGVKDTLARLELFDGRSMAFEVARDYLTNKELSHDLPPTSVYTIAAWRLYGPISAMEIGKRAASLLIEAGQMSVDELILGAGRYPRWNTMQPFMIDQKGFALAWMVQSAKSSLRYALSMIGRK